MKNWKTRYDLQNVSWELLEFEWCFFQEKGGNEELNMKIVSLSAFAFQSLESFKRLAIFKEAARQTGC